MFYKNIVSCFKITRLINFHKETPIADSIQQKIRVTQGKVFLLFPDWEPMSVMVFLDKMKGRSWDGTRDFYTHTKTEMSSPNVT